MLQIVNNISQSIREHKLIKAEKKLLVACSGGQDSICLILILYLLRSQIQFSFDLIWVNHFWQKSTFFTMLHMSKSNRCFSSRTILWLPLTQVFSEQSARDWRRAALQRTHFFYEYDSSAQGHNKSDRVETVFFNLMRGTGQSGVSSLHWIDNQICFCTNKFYPIFFKLLKQTHFKTTRMVSSCHLSKMTNKDSTKDKYIQESLISSNKCNYINNVKKTNSSMFMKMKTKGILSSYFKKNTNFRFKVSNSERLTNSYYQLKRITLVDHMNFKI